MFSLLTWYANWRAKRKYVFKELFDAGIAEIGAKAALKNADKTTALIAQMTKEADEMDARIKEVAEMEEKGFWLCDDGHEDAKIPPVPQDDGHQITCSCGKPMKLVKRDQMTGQEKYESDKERKEVEAILADKRKAIEGQKAELENQQNTAKMHMTTVNRSRAFAKVLHSL